MVSPSTLDPSASRGAQFPNIRNAAVHDVLVDVASNAAQGSVADDLKRLAATQAGADLLSEATVRISRALLLAKIVPPANESQFLAQIQKDLAVVTEHRTLALLACMLVDIEAANEDDTYRDRREITDPLYTERIMHISLIVERATLSH